jgi:hypothetical protein
VKKKVNPLIKLDPFLINLERDKNKINEIDKAIYTLEIPYLCNIKKIIKLNEITKLFFEIIKGSLKINSSIIGNNKDIFNILVGVRIISFIEGYKLKYLSGVTKNSPVIMSINIRIRHDLHTSFRK